MSDLITYTKKGFWYWVYSTIISLGLYAFLYVFIFNNPVLEQYFLLGVIILVLSSFPISGYIIELVERKVK